MIRIHLTIMVYTGEKVKREEMLDLPDGSRIVDIMQELKLDQAEWTALLNGRYARPGQLLEDGCRLVFMEPLTGG